MKVDTGAHVNIAFFTTVIVPILTVLCLIITALAGIITLWSTVFRERARRLAICDLATKRLAFRELLLKVDLAVTIDGSDQQVQAKDASRRAAQKIHLDANSAMEDLVWKTKINRRIGWRTIKAGWGRVTWELKAVWVFSIFISLVLLSAGLFSMGLLLWELFTGTKIPDTSPLKASIFFLLCSVVARWFLFQAEVLKHQRAEKPVIDVL